MTFLHSTLALLLWAALAAPSGDIVVLVLKGGKTVKGEVLREHLKGILLKDEPDFIPWSQVTSVNGRTPRDRVEQLRQTLRAVLCEDCDGGRVALLCPECQGSGKSYDTKLCGKCAGATPLPCAVKGCDKGKVDCPVQFCLKRSVGYWKEHPANPSTRTFICRDEAGQIVGGVVISDKHLGEVIEYKPGGPIPSCPKCTKTACKECREQITFTLGLFKTLGECKVCGGPYKGAGRVPCTTCLASGFQPCTDCLGTKALPRLDTATPCAHCKDGVMRCGLCDDTGLNDPKARKGAPVVQTAVLNLRGDLRAAIAKIDESKGQVSDRVSFRDGRSVQGQLIQRGASGILLLVRPPNTQELQILPALFKQGFKLGAAMPGAPVVEDKKDPSPSAPATPPPAAATDTVVLKDGTTVSGKIVAKTEELLMVQTPDGKFVKIEASKVAEIKSAPKPPPK